MKTKHIYSLLCFLFLLVLSVIHPKALTLEEANEQLELLQVQLESTNLEINSIQADIELYGSDYRPYDTYNNVVNSTNEESTDYYETNSNSFLDTNIENNVDEKLTLANLLAEKTEEQRLLLLEIETKQSQVENLQRQSEIYFNVEDVTKPSNLTVEEIEIILDGTPLAELAQDFYDAEQEYQVNALFIISIAALESGWGTSHRAVYDNNLTGFGVYSADAEGINGPTKRDNIMMTAEALHNNYLTEGGAYHNGTSISSVGICYCVGDTWAGKVSTIGNNLYQEALALYEIEIPN